MISNPASYLQLTDSAVLALKDLVRASNYADPVVIFYSLGNSTLADSKRALQASGVDIEVQRKFADIKARSKRYTESSKLVVDCVPRSDFSEDCLVSFDGILINAPYAPGFHGQYSVVLDYANGEFSLQKS